MSELEIRDDIAERNLELTCVAVKTGEYGEPWFDLDLEGFREFREGRRAVPPLHDPSEATAMMMENVAGEEVLLLAGGGGQQSAEFSLCGAKVTVLDLTPEQLERDRAVAAHYGYEVVTIQGDMRDLSRFPDHHFARVHQPISTLYVPDLGALDREVARVLRPGGLYNCSYTYPILYMAENRGWDGEAYAMRFSQPHRSGRVLETKPDGLLNYEEGVFFGEFHHRMPDIINSLVDAGLQIVRFWDVPARAEGSAAGDHTPGSPEHQSSILPFGVVVVSRRDEQNTR